MSNTAKPAKPNTLTTAQRIGLIIGCAAPLLLAVIFFLAGNQQAGLITAMTAPAPIGAMIAGFYGKSANARAKARRELRAATSETQNA